MFAGVSNSFANMIALPNPAPQALNAGDISSSARAYLALQDSDSGTKTDSPQTDTSRNPAVVISFTEQAQQTLHAMNESFERRRQELAEAENAQGPFAGRIIEVAEEPKGLSPEEVRLQGLLRIQTLQKDQLASHRAAYDSLLNTKPVPPRQLIGKAKEAAFDLLSSHGYGRPGTNQTVSFSVDNLTYTFKGDGTVWTNDGRVPTSEAAKQTVLNTLGRSISFAQQDLSGLASLSGDALNARIDDLYKQFSPPS